MLEKIKEKLENSDYIFINKSKFISTQNINFNLWDSCAIPELKHIYEYKFERLSKFTSPQLDIFINVVQYLGFFDDSGEYVNNAIEDLIALQYKKDDNIYHLYLDEIRNATFIVKSLEKYSFYEEKIKKFIDANWSKDVDFNDIFSKK